jgi:hypothetical protein
MISRAPYLIMERIKRCFHVIINPYILGYLKIKIYLAQNRDRWQAGVDRVKVIWLRKGTGGRLVWTG